MSTRGAAAWIAAFAFLVLVAQRTIVWDDRPPPWRDEVVREDRAELREAPRGARVERVVDGDTIVIAAGRRRERVRYIGIDTPESVKPGVSPQCFGKRATALNERLVEGRSVTLRYDREPRDRHGRLLAYVYAGDRMINAELLRAGAARTLEVPPNTRHAPSFLRLETRARRRGEGLWGACYR